MLSHAATPSASGPESTFRVRSTNPAMLELLAEGAGRSAAFRALMTAIDHTNGFVYVEFGHCAFGHLDGCLLPFIASTNGDRYVRVIVTPDRNRVSHDRLLALIAHELQHAREVLEHADVVDLPSMDAMYRKIGTPIAGGPRGFETSAARAAGTAVLAELERSVQAPRVLREAVIASATSLPINDGELRSSVDGVEPSHPVSTSRLHR